MDHTWQQFDCFTKYGGKIMRVKVIRTEGPYSQLCLFCCGTLHYTVNTVQYKELLTLYSTKHCCDVQCSAVKLSAHNCFKVFFSPYYGHCNLQTEYAQGPNHLKCITRWEGRDGVTISIFFQHQRDGHKTTYLQEDTHIKIRNELNYVQAQFRDVQGHYWASRIKPK